jgi:hypothetical protein
VLCVSRANLDQVAVFTRNVMDLQHFRAIGERLGYALIGRGLVAPDRDECKQTQAKSLRVDLRTIAANDASRFEFPDPLENSRWGQPNRAGNIDLGFAGVCLKLVENLEIYRIESSFGCHNRIISSGRHHRQSNILLDAGLTEFGSAGTVRDKWRG